MQRKMLLIVQAAIAVSCLIYALIGWFLGSRGIFPPEREPAPISGYLKPAFLAISVALFPLLRVLQRRLHENLRSPERMGQTEANRAPVAGYIIFFALAEIPAILGLVLFMLGQPLKTLFLCVGLSLLYLAFMTPPGDILDVPSGSPPDQFRA